MQRCRDKPEYLYVANPCSWKATVELTFSAGAKVTDLNRGRPVSLGVGGTWKVELPPYGVQSFRVEGAGPEKILKAITTLDAEAIAGLRRQVEEERKLTARFAKAIEFAKQVASLQAALDRGHYRVVEESLRGGYEYHRARQAALGGKGP